MMDLLNLEPNKVSTDLTQYPMTIIAISGDGKTDTLKRILEDFNEEGKKPLFLMFEDRYKGIEGIYPLRIKSYPEILQAIQMLKNPQILEKYSCLVIDTVQKFETMVINYTCNARNTKSLKDIGKWGKGTEEFRHDLSVLDELKNLGLPVHYIVQAEKTVDQDTDQESFIMKMKNKNTYQAIIQESFMVGYLVKKQDEEGKDRYFLTFKKSEKYPDLKDTWGMPTYVEYNNLKEEMLKCIEAKGIDNITNETTMTFKEVEKKPFKELMSECKDLYAKLYKAGYENELLAIRKERIGVDEDTEEPLSLNSLVENQRHLVEVVVLEMQKVAEKNNI